MEVLTVCRKYLLHSISSWHKKKNEKWEVSEMLFHSTHPFLEFEQIDDNIFIGQWKGFVYCLATSQNFQGISLKRQSGISLCHYFWRNYLYIYVTIFQKKGHLHDLYRFWLGLTLFTCILWILRLPFSAFAVQRSSIVAVPLGRYARQNIISSS